MSPPALIQLEGYACTFLYGIPLIKKAFVKLYHSKSQWIKIPRIGCHCNDKKLISRG